MRVGQISDYADQSPAATDLRHHMWGIVIMENEFEVFRVFSISIRIYIIHREGVVAIELYGT